MATATDQAEGGRRSELCRYAQITDCPVRQLTLVDGLCSALEKIERRSRVLLGKHTAARFVDKGEDSKEVARLIDCLREAITHYQVGENRIVAPYSAAH